MVDMATVCQPHRRLVQEGVQKQRLKPESGQSERLESSGRQKQLIAMSPNEEAGKVRSHDMELEVRWLSVQLGRLMWSARQC